MKHFSRPVAFLPLLLAAIGGCRYSPIGTGQHEVSPDGRYDANATFWYDGSEEWLVLKVTDVGSGKVIWKKNLGNRADGHPPFDQGIGYLDLIQWAEDSTEVCFANRSREVKEVIEWMTVQLDDQGQVISTEKVPGSRFRSIDPSKVLNLPETDERLTSASSAYRGDYYLKGSERKPVTEEDE
jgi:hypothetical protein